VHIFHISSL